jgi:amino acid transporter
VSHFGNFQIDKRFGILVRALLWSELVIVILGLINLGSPTAFDALVSLALLGQCTTYVVLTIFILARRIHPGAIIPLGPRALGKWRTSINVFAIIFSIITISFNVLPPCFPVTPKNMNYAGVVFRAA